MRQSPNDSLRVYLSQIGAIPLLTCGEEIALVNRIRTVRQRFRRKLLTHPCILRDAVALLEKVCNSGIRMDRVIAVSLANSQETSRVRRILGPNLRTLRNLLERDRIDFAVAVDKSRSQSCRREAWRRSIRNRHKAAQLVEEVNLRTRCLLPMLERLRGLATRMEKLNLRLREDGNGSAKDSPAGKLHALQHELMQITGEPPVALCRRVARTLKMKQEHDEVRQLLARANLRLVVSVARRYRRHGLGLSDLIQAGNVGLMQAVDKYDPNRGSKFSTYATWWIRQAMMQAITDEGRLVCIPIHRIDRIRRVRSLQEQLAHQYGRPPTVEELAQAADLPAQEAESAVSIMNQPLSIEQPINDSDSKRLGDILESRNGSANVEIRHKNLVNCVADSLTVLDDRERAIIGLRFGLHDGYSCTLEEASKALSLSRERVRQIQEIALQTLRHPSLASRFAEFVERPTRTLCNRDDLRDSWRRKAVVGGEL